MSYPHLRAYLNLMNPTSTPKLMQAARLHSEGGRFQLEEVPVPTPRPTDVLVKVVAAGVVPNLRNVIAAYPDGARPYQLPKLPAIFGLDAAGVVAAVGERVREGVNVGDRVYINPGLYCGACDACRRQDFTTCPSYTFMGYFGFGPRSQDQYDGYPYGGFGEYLTAPVANLVKLPENVTFEQACRFGYLGTAYSGLRKTGLSAGQTVLVNGGTGTLGVGAVLLSLAMGASRVFATGRDHGRLDRLQSLAPERIVSIPVTEGSIAARVLELTDGVGADVMLEALAPYSPAATVVDAFNGLRRGGRAVNVGGVFETLPIEPVKLMVQQKSLMGSLWFSTAEGQDMARMAEAGTLKLDVFENELFPLAGINEALDATETRCGGFTNIVIKHQ